MSLLVSKDLLYRLLVGLTLHISPAGGIFCEFIILVITSYPSISGGRKPEFLSGFNKFIFKACGLN
jgi:hypothetical protein